MSSGSVNRKSSNDDNMKDPNKEDWQKKMLRRLIDSAVPVPIKVACTVSPPGLPPYLGEEYHGRISKEEEKRLLEGMSGRYIVRDSFSSSTGLNEYTLAFNHDQEIQHVKLFYSPLFNTFTTDWSEKNFKTILELMTDVLTLYRDLARRESTIGATKKEKYSKPHVFKTHTYKHPKWCDECGNFLWGIINQGYKCEDCGLNVHKNCKLLAPIPCINVVFGRKNGERMDKKRGSTQEEETIANNYARIPSKMITHPSAQCQYFKQCSRFLSAFNIRDTFINMEHTLTRCFGDCCIEKREDMRDENMCNNLKQWTRFEVAQQPDKLKRNISEWETVYFAIAPRVIENMIRECFNPPEEDHVDLVVAPSLAYTVQDMINENWSYKFTDTRTNGELYAQTVLEVYVRPGSYHVMTSLNRAHREKHLCGTSLVIENWKVKYQKDVYPKAVLVRIFEDPNDA